MIPKNEPIAHATSQDSAVTDSEYAIYMAILGKTSSDFVVKDKNTVQNVFGISDSNIVKEFEGLDADTFSDFMLNNKQSFSLEGKFFPAKNYVLIS